MALSTHPRAAYNRQLATKTYHARKAEGYCTVRGCLNDARPGKVRCAACAKADAARWKRWWRKTRSKAARGA